MEVHTNHRNLTQESFRKEFSDSYLNSLDKYRELSQVLANYYYYGHSHNKSKEWNKVLFESLHSLLNELNFTKDKVSQHILLGKIYSWFKGKTKGYSSVMERSVLTPRTPKPQHELSTTNSTLYFKQSPISSPPAIIRDISRSPVSKSVKRFNRNYTPDISIGDRYNTHYLRNRRHYIQEFGINKGRNSNI